ncbi:MAG: serine O-acetyltransferase, partial [Actinobacteria bacterium]|nr:serine O-acetyltransferase [Actinomycetota bacterium]
GDDVVLYQGVTLGGTGKETGKRHPTIEDGAVVGVGASVLGNTTVGKNAKVGGGAVVVDDVPPGCTVVGIPGHIVKCNGERIRPSKTSALRHENLPDPIVDALEELQKRIDRLEQRITTSTETQGSSQVDAGDEVVTGDTPE